MDRAALKQLIADHVGEFSNDPVLAKHLILDHHMSTSYLDGADPNGFWAIRKEVRNELARAGIADTSVPREVCPGSKVLMEEMRAFLLKEKAPVPMTDLAIQLGASVEEIVKVIEGCTKSGITSSSRIAALKSATRLSRGVRLRLT